MPTRIRKLLKFSENNGLSATLKLIHMNILHELRWHLDRGIDRSYGTDTSDRIELADLDIVGNNRNSGVYYEPTPTALFISILNQLQSTISSREFTYLDFGSGKGRTLLLAADFDFKTIIGIEFSRELHSIAERNIQLYHARKSKHVEIQSILTDAVTYRPPQDNLFIYLYNPFGKDVLRKVLENISSAIDVSRSKVVLVYLNPLSCDIVEESGVFQKCLKIALPHDYTRERQRSCNVYFNWQEAPGLLLHSAESKLECGAN